MTRGFAIWVAMWGATLACHGPDSSAPPVALRRDLALTAKQQGFLATLAADADAHPDDFAARKASGLAHMWFTLSGVLALQGRAEADLEAAFDLDPSDPELARSLGRFYNLRGVVGDASKADRQVQVYRALLGDRDVDTMDPALFAAWSFSRLGIILGLRSNGRLLEALGEVRALEDALASRAAAEPSNVELAALAGNFAFFFAGNIPIGRKDRVRAAVDYFTRVRRHWSEIRPGAADPDRCPNTYENFMFELAEGHLVLGEVDDARIIYRELQSPRDPRTRAKEEIAFVASERLANAELYAGKMALMPPWPSDVGNCVVCHAWQSDVPLTSLEIATPVTLDDIPSAAVANPAWPVLDVPDAITSLVARRCKPCHFAGGEAESLASFETKSGLLGRARSIDRRVTAGEMPPNAPLPASEQHAIATWARR